MFHITDCIGSQITVINIKSRESISFGNKSPEVEYFTCCSILCRDFHRCTAFAKTTEEYRENDVNTRIFSCTIPFLPALQDSVRMSPMFIWVSILLWNDFTKLTKCVRHLSLRKTPRKGSVSNDFSKSATTKFWARRFCL